MAITTRQTTGTGVTAKNAPLTHAELDQNFIELTESAKYQANVVLSRPSIRPSLLLDFANSKVLDPQITFTRASEGRYYDGKTVAKAEENLLLYSQAMTTSPWIIDGVTVVSGKTAPDGTSTAFSVTATSGGQRIYQSYTPITGATYTRSIYMRRVSGSGQVLFRRPDNTDIDVSGLISSNWERIVLTSASGGGTGFIVKIVTLNDVIEIWGAQLEQRSSVTAYTPTTSQPITNYLPVLQSAAANVARFDHDPITGESKGLLIEEQRTNLLTYSEQFDNAAWGKTNSSITANTIVAPDGTLTGDKLVENTSTAWHYVAEPYVSITAQTYTFTVYAKAAERSVLQIIPNSTVFPGAYANFDLVAGTVSATGGIDSASITSVGNGWYRCIVVDTATSASSAAAAFLTLQNSPSATRTGTYTGDGYSGIYIWGAQLEAVAFPTSYIPTVDAQVTRSADSASMTGTNFSSWYRQDEGSVFVEYQYGFKLAAIRTVAFTDGTGSNFLEVVAAPGSVPTTGTGSYLFGGSGGVFSISTQSGSSLNVVAFAQRKFAGAYALNDFASCNNAGPLGTDTNDVVPVVDRLFFGNTVDSNNAKLCGWIRKIAYYPARLTNAQLQALTS